MDIFPVILCGGAGTRLWPASTAARPKPFIPLLDERSPLQHTALRVAGLPGDRTPIVVVGARHAALARRQLADIGVAAFIVAEPEGRDSGPALTAAALWVSRTAPHGIALAVACDHHIPDGAVFRAGAIEAAGVAEQGWIVTFGVKPTSPATAYGYIRPGAPLETGGTVRRVEAFIEKPDATKARACLAARHLWNSGNFVFRVDILLEEIALHALAMGEAVGRAVDEGASSEGLLELGPAFASAEPVSIDVAVMEKTARAAVLEVGYAWSDLGSWNAVWAASPRDVAGNVVAGRAVLAGSTGCLIRADASMRIVAVGLKMIAVVVQDGEILVCDLAASGQELKDAVAKSAER
ncbi:MAG: sugar phosphate nucleotidyltransferase [Caulobacteraceae bacterium]